MWGVIEGIDRTSTNNNNVEINVEEVEVRKTEGTERHNINTHSVIMVVDTHQMEVKSNTQQTTSSSPCLYRHG